MRVPPRVPSNSSKVFPSLPVTFSPTVRPRKSFSCNTYGSFRKCCKQKTYSRARPFRCNRKQGEQGVMVNDHPPDIEVWTLRPSDFRFHPLLFELCVLCALCAKSFFVFELSTVNLFILPQQIGFPPPHPIKSPLCPLSERKRTRQDEATS